MRLIYHRLAVRDVREILSYYEEEAGTRLADRFFEELLEILDRIIANPRHFPPFGGVMRRANLGGFPYHVIFQEKDWGVKVMIVRHHRRHPKYGLRRK